jgi:hypothetical protein
MQPIKRTLVDQSGRWLVVWSATVSRHIAANRRTGRANVSCNRFEETVNNPSPSLTVPRTSWPLLLIFSHPHTIDLCPTRLTLIDPKPFSMYSSAPRPALRLPQAIS